MICNQCGANCPEGVKFCDQCGTQLVREEAAEAPADATTPSEAPQPAPIPTMRCPVCGKQTNRNLQLCEYCGADLERTKRQIEAQRRREKERRALEYARTEMRKKCRKQHIWTSILCGLMGLLWFVDTASAADGYISYSLYDAFDGGFWAICALLFSFWGAFLVFSAVDADAYQPSFLYRFVFVMAYLFNLIGLWTFIGIPILELFNGEEARILYFTDFPYAVGISFFGIVYIAIVITYCVVLGYFTRAYKKCRR